jgi:hypothetical protein
VPEPDAPSPLDPLRGAARLAIDATTGVASVVEEMHVALGRGPAVLGRPLELPVRALTAPLYGAVRGVTRAVGAAVDAVLSGAGAALPPGALAGAPAPPGSAALLAILNGVLGDRLAAAGNPLARAACLVHAGCVLDPAAGLPALPSRWLLVLVHGSCLDERSFARPGQELWTALGADLGATPVHLRYNTGLHVAENGRLLAGLLEQLVQARPGGVDRISLVGHSMGGLVARAALHAGEQSRHAWRERVRDYVSLGTPHLGAPLERAGHLVDALLAGTPWTFPLARVGRIRSAGVTDLRHGAVLDGHADVGAGAGADAAAAAAQTPARERPVVHPLPLPADVRCHAVAGSLSPPGAPRLRGDGLVPVASALGRHADPARALAFAEADRMVIRDTGHVAMLGRREVLDQVRAWLGAG